MRTKHQLSQIHKTLFGLFSNGILFVMLCVGNMPAARAQEAGPSTLISEGIETQYGPLISNSLFLYASTVLDFDTQMFLDQQNGPLKNYSEEIDGRVWTASDSIAFNAILYGINPQILIVLLEAQGNLITKIDSDIPLRSSPIVGSTDIPNFYYYIKWLSETGQISFNARRDYQDNSEVTFASGESIKVPLDLNAGTYGLQVVLAKILPIDLWSYWVTGDNPIFKQTFTDWFGDSLLDPDSQDISAQALPGGFNLPFPVGSTWYYTGGPHNYNGGTPGCISGSGCPRFWSSVDIAPPEVTSCSPGSTSYNSRWIVATRGGTVITSQTALVVIDHGDGWRTYYSHVSSTDRRGTGGVNQGDNLGHPSCEVEPSGFTSGIHVHFAIYQVGTGFINIAGSSLSGWSIGETSHYNGTMTRQGVNRTATTGRHNGTNDIINNGSGGGNECSSTISLPAGYTKCADETGTCNFNGTADVVFGSGNRYTLKSGVVNSISCSITAFGCDPNYGVQKECYYKITSGGSNTWSAKYFSGDTHWWDINSTNNQMCTDTLNGPNLDKNYGDDPACSGQSGDHWVGDYKSTINFSSGNYVFEVEHDDGLKLYLDGQNIAERGDYSTFQPICPARSISGNHELWAILREDGGQAKIKVNWSTNTSLCDSPGAFSKSSPSHGASTQPTSLTLNWGSSSGSNSYEYCIDTTNDNSCNTWVGVGNTTIANLSGLSEGTTYYWQVKATNFADPTYANGDLTAFWSFTTQSSQPLPDILYNGGFEEGYTVEPWAYPYGWYKTAWIMDNSTFTWDTTQKHSGNRSAKISNNTSNDARWTATVWVQPNADYRLSGWIKTENIAQNGDRGANLSILGGWISTTKLYGTNDWTFVSVDFNTEANEFIEVAARIGMYSGEISGTAWFDDLKLELLSSPTCYTLTTTSLPAEGGNVTVVTIPNCANGTQYVHGTMVSLAANSNSGYAFSNWNGANPTFVTPGRTIIASNKNVTANFNLSAPLNDDFNSAIDVALHSTENLDTRSATQNNDDPQIPACLMNAGKATVWYKYTPSTDSAISLDTKGADYDTFIAVWAGTRNLLIPVACNDDTGGTYQSAVAFQVQAGVTYYIEVGEWDGYYGASAMSVKPPVR